MVSEVGTVSNSYAIAPRATVGAARQESPAPQTETTSNSPGSPGSPRITVDPTVGVILEFIGNSGQVVAQSPSFAAVAYLRAGLTSEGYSNRSDETAVTA